MDESASVPSRAVRAWAAGSSRSRRMIRYLREHTTTAEAAQG